MIYHIVVGDLAAAPLQEALAQEKTMQGEVIVIKDMLNVGPILKIEGQKFSDLRSQFWNEVVLNEKTPIVMNDLERLLATTNEISKSNKTSIWLWIAPLPADVCMMHWAMQYFIKYVGNIYIVNVAGLPFLDNDNKLYYPKNIAEITPKEIIKARKLARIFTLSEMETYQEEWGILQREQTDIRILEGSKKLLSKNEAFYDVHLLSFCTHQFQKASKIINQAINKFSIPTGDLFLGWRLRKLADAGKLILVGETNKGLRDYEIRIPGEDKQLELNIEK